MKKKLLITSLIVLALVCLFAICVSAEEMNPEYNAEYVKTMTQNMTTVELEDGTKVDLYDAQGYTLCYYWDNVASATRTLKSVRTKDLKFNFSGTKLSSIYYGDEELAGSAKAGKIVVLNLRGVKNSEGKDITDFNGDNMFKEDSPLQHIFMPDTIEHLNGYAFGHRDGSLSHLRGCYFSENSLLKEIKSSTFMNARQLRGFYIPKGVKYVGGNGFQGCWNAFFVNDPYDFLTKPEVYYFPDGFYKAEGEAFDSIKNNLNNVLVFSADNMEITNEFAFEVVACDSNSTKPIIVFKGTISSISTAYWNVSAMYFTNEAYLSEADVVGFTRKCTCGNNHSKTWDGGAYFCHATDNTDHLYKVAVNTAPTCTTSGVNGTTCFCGKPNPVGTTVIDATHDYGKTPIVNGWVYSNGYFKDAHYSHECQICHEQYVSKDAIEDTNLFVKGGYSIPEAGTTDCISHTIKVSKENIKKYYDATGTEVSYGIVAAVGSSLGTPIKLDGNGKAVANGDQALVGDMTDTAYTKLVVKISNIPENTEINCNAYVVINKKDIYYLCGEEVTETAVAKTL